MISKSTTTPTTATGVPAFVANIIGIIIGVVVAGAIFYLLGGRRPEARPQATTSATAAEGATGTSPSSSTSPSPALAATATLATAEEAASPVAGVKTVLLDTTPHYLRSLWRGFDPYNRDPVCYGDPTCRDAYFRDWPYARRPWGGWHHNATAHKTPAATNNTNTNTQNVSVSLSPPQTTTTAAGGIAGTTPPMSTTTQAAAISAAATPVGISSIAADPEPLHAQVQEVIVSGPRVPDLGAAARGADIPLPTEPAASPETAMLTEGLFGQEEAMGQQAEPVDAQQQIAAGAGLRRRRRQCTSPLSCGSAKRRPSAFAQHQYAAMPY
jgi:hypothetical protein